ncbi:MAG: nuclear transport factor 2 family protein [Armatimonadetes bacterium]|nr:nuclear transport factor 2 family protein [Armatimonadota bacterium]
MPVNVLERAKRALIDLDARALVSLYADTFLFEDISAGLRIETKQALKEYFDSLFAWPNVEFSDVHFFGIADRGAGQWTWQGTSRQTGTPFAIRGASLFRLTGSTIAEEIIFYDPRKAYA